MQLEFDNWLSSMVQLKKMKYGDCLLEEDEETKDTFRIMWYLEDKKRVISKNHSMWDMYNLMAIEHVQELGLHIKTLSCIARKVVIVRARIFQCLCMDEYCTRDYQIYDHLNN
ncbi:hypothetical protein L3Y34_010192 [Caenorhabditis briggsae]|uniref:Uncharacterized protein n=1 Tax=Caenorhabditis briggsae TaxID=6238 RepID=A0AAE8ZQW1_CAEBR|nr:hypothetical protein L3Y34_010192 [Caenorhabditis briggsae]